jgi:hypothetical protein
MSRAAAGGLVLPQFLIFSIPPRLAAVSPKIPHCFCGRASCGRAGGVLFYKLLTL